MADVAYCMKCREKREFEGSLVTLKNGRPALQGSCPVCGTKLTKILGMDAANEEKIRHAKSQYRPFHAKPFF